MELIHASTRVEPDQWDGVEPEMTRADAEADARHDRPVLVSREKHDALHADISAAIAASGDFEAA